MNKFVSGTNRFLILTLTILSITCLKSQTIEDSLWLNKYKEVANRLVSTALTERKGYDVLKNLCTYLLRRK